MSELKPCPLCGAQLSEVHYSFYGGPDGLWLMHLPDEQAKCPMAALTFRATPAAITAWNTRASDARIAELKAEVERLRAQLQQSSPQPDYEARVLSTLVQP